MKKKRYVVKPRLKIFLALLALGYFGLSLLKQEIKINQQNERIHDLREQIVQAEDTTAELERLIQYTESENTWKRSPESV